MPVSSAATSGRPRRMKYFKALSIATLDKSVAAKIIASFLYLFIQNAKTKMMAAMLMNGADPKNDTPNIIRVKISLRSE